MLDTSCSKCGSLDTQRAEVIYDSGVSHTNTQSTAVGWGYGADGGVGVATIQSQGMQQTRLSNKAAPPAKAGWAFCLLLFFGSWLFFGAYPFWVAGIDAILLIIIFACVNYNTADWPLKYAHWKSVYGCLRCGNWFVPSVDSAPRLVKEVIAMVNGGQRHCTQCGQRAVSSNDRFCAACGNALATVINPQTVSLPQVSLPPEIGPFCKYCGDGAADVEAVDGTYYHRACQTHHYNAMNEREQKP